MRALEVAFRERADGCGVACRPTGHGHCRRDDPEATDGVVDGIRSCCGHDLKVSYFPLGVPGRGADGSLSSRAPDELYKNGIQREQFVPCIELIKERFKVQCLDSDIGSAPATSRSRRD